LHAVLGLKPLDAVSDSKLDDVIQILIQMRKDARQRKDFASSDQIRNILLEKGIQLKDEKDGSMSYSLL
ncbi:MAG TPA: cysteine--tRNA ligase, partial [Chitinophagaceae bacterium]|nr:cysteine--tRNA ligase [Chitinophagaceae bacterium]